MAHLDSNGHEILDDTPVARPVRISTRPSSLNELKQLLHIVSREAEQNGTETFEEAEDFDVGDDAEPFSPFEIPADHELDEFVEALRERKKRKAKLPPESTPVVPGTPPSSVPPSAVGNATNVPSTPIQNPTTP